MLCDGFLLAGFRLALDAGLLPKCESPEADTSGDSVARSSEHDAEDFILNGKHGRGNILAR
jgi:hypothetical protein